MLAAALMLAFAVPETTARADIDLDEDLTANMDLQQEDGAGGGYGSWGGGKAPAYSKLPWYRNTQSTSNVGKAKNKILPNLSATGNHVVYKTSPSTGKITNYAVFNVNTKNPTGFDEVIRYDGVGSAHTNSVTGKKIMPHIHDKNTPGKVREVYTDEIPR